jgi:hypothetical protein
MKNLILIPFVFAAIFVGCEPLAKLELAPSSKPSIAKILEKEASESFDKAEKTVYVNVVPVKPEDGTNEDPKKCICKGTGIITHGDGHTSPCPYHGK